MVLDLVDKHQKTLDAAVRALHKRTFYAHFNENPSPVTYGEDADQNAKERFQNLRHNKFEELQQLDPTAWVGQEESPYEQQPLGILYPYFNPETLVARAAEAFQEWRKVKPIERAGLLLEVLERLEKQFFTIAHATMHTTGQAFLMAFQAAGPHAADRALEAVAAGYEELTRFPEEVLWEKPMGKYDLRLHKSWRPVPKGIALAIGCATFPTWNTLPGLFASLVTGNPVIVKPHPKAVLPIAIVVAELQQLLAESGYNPHICQLAVDADTHYITKELAEHPLVKLIDYTGGTAFGNYIEELPGKISFTEKAGVNAVIIDSVEDLDKVMQNLAFSVSLYSGQMCTAPQNFFVPATGIKVGAEQVPYATVVQKLREAVSALVSNPKAAPHILGAIQNPATEERVKQVGAAGGALSGTAYDHPQFSNARTCTPVLCEVEATADHVYGQEMFGPIMYVVKTNDTPHALELARELAEKHGAISCGAYTTNEEVKEQIKDMMSLVGVPVCFNLIGNTYMNQNAAFSDLHVTGGNPAGNASITNPEFIVKRFTWVGFKEPAL